MTTKITKIEIKIDDKVIKLNVKQAKELKSVLAGMFPDMVTTYPYPVYIERPWRWWDTVHANTTIYLEYESKWQDLTDTKPYSFS